MKNIKNVQFNIKQGDTILVHCFREIDDSRMSELKEYYSCNNTLKVVIEWN